MADQLEQLKQKYASVMMIIQQQNVQLKNVNMAQNKLYIKGVAPTNDAKNKVWDQVKLVDASYSDLTLDLDVSDSAAPAQTQSATVGNQGGQSYTIKAGDTLTGISQHFFGKASEFQKIMDANPDITDPDKIHVGQTIKIPA